MKLKWFIFLALLVIGMPIYYFFYGTPWGVKEYKHRVLNYLEKKYHQEFIIDQVQFDFFHSRYTSTAHTKNQPNLKFYINPGPEGTEFSDSYYFKIAERQMKGDWDPVIKRLYPDCSTYSIEIIEYNDGEVPNYIENGVIGIGISLEQITITDDNKELELSRAYELLRLVKEKGVKLGYFQITYKNKLLQVQPDEVKGINDIEKFLIDYK